MTIRFSCPHCNATFSVPDSAAGKRGRCKKCATTITIPSVSDIVLEPDAKQTHPESTPPAPVPGDATAETGKSRRSLRIGLLVIPFCLILAVLIVGAILLPGNQTGRVRRPGAQRAASRGNANKNHDKPIPPPKIASALLELFAKKRKKNPFEKR